MWRVLQYLRFKYWRSSSVGQSARLIFVMSGVQIPPPLPDLLNMIILNMPYRISFFGGGTDYSEWYLRNVDIKIKKIILQEMIKKSKILIINKSNLASSIYLILKKIGWKTNSNFKLNLIKTYKGYLNYIYD